MNEHTLITVCGYTGDQHQIENLTPWYLHHEAPVIVMSPEDSPITKLKAAPTVICRQAGKRAYIGQDSLDRQLLHMKIALQYDFDFFLMHDSDSVCVSPVIPQHMYAEDFVWSNEVGEDRPHASPYPKIAMQPPYGLSRKNLEKLVAVAPRVLAHPITPYIDWFFVALCSEAGIQHRAWWDKEKDFGTPHPTELIAQDPWNEMWDRVRNHGRVMVHPIKTLEWMQRLDTEHKLFKQLHES